jgi:outer membrane protein TolC
MKTFFPAFLLLLSLSGFGQVRSQQNATVIADSLNNPYIDSLIKRKLIELALQNPAFKEADAMITSAQYELKGANTVWLNSIVLSGNINEFVINNTNINGIPASTLYPKYNFGVNIPLGLFTRQEKNIAKEKVKIYDSQKDQKKRALTKEVLQRYENYKEKKELLNLQKLITDEQYSNYQQYQRDFASGEVKDIKDVNKEYQAWLQERTRLRTSEKDLKLAQLEIEEIIGSNFLEVLKTITTNK